MLRASFFGQPISDIFVWYGSTVNGTPNQTFTANGAVNVQTALDRLREAIVARVTEAELEIRAARSPTS